MCVERVHRIMMALILILSGYLMSIFCVAGLILQGFVVVMLIIWALTDFCPAIKILSKFLPNCSEKCK